MAGSQTSGRAKSVRTSVAGSSRNDTGCSSTAGATGEPLADGDAAGSDAVGTSLGVTSVVGTAEAPGKVIAPDPSVTVLATIWSPNQPAKYVRPLSVSCRAASSPTCHTYRSGPRSPSLGRAEKANHWPSTE